MVAFVMLDIVSLVLAIVVAGDNISKIDMFLFFFLNPNSLCCSSGQINSNRF